MRLDSSPGWAASPGDCPAGRDSESRRRKTFATRIADLDAQHPEGAGDEPAVLPNRVDRNDRGPRLDRRANQRAPVSRVGCRAIREVIPLEDLVKVHHRYPLIRGGQRDASWWVDIEFRDLPAHLGRREAADRLGGPSGRKASAATGCALPGQGHERAYPHRSLLHPGSLGAGNWRVARCQGTPKSIAAHLGSIPPPCTQTSNHVRAARRTTEIPRS